MIICMVCTMLYLNWANHIVHNLKRLIYNCLVNNLYKDAK